LARYFFAVVPPEPQNSTIDALRERWGHPHHSVEPHITVKAPFEWHEQPESFLAPVSAACAAVEPFGVSLPGTGRFGEDRVLFLTVAGDGLKALHQAVISALEGLLRADPRAHEGEDYSPHLTLAVGRFGIDAAGMADMERAAQAELADPGTFRVEALRCYAWHAVDHRWVPVCDIPIGR
jgi:2'-5' RNA ligase